MLTLTKIQRSYVIDHIMPSDLDKNDIKHGLQLKEKMLKEIDDEYIKKTIPNWQNMERFYKKNGLTEYADKILCGEMSFNDLPKPTAVKCDVWARWKPFQVGEELIRTVQEVRDTEYEGNLKEKITYDFDRWEDYTPWEKFTDTGTLTLTKKYDIMLQLQIVIYGEEAGRYFPYQSYDFGSGFEFVDDNLILYDIQSWERNEDGTLVGCKQNDKSENVLRVADSQEPYYRLFFRNRLGYEHYEWFKEDNDWMNENYPGLTARTILCDPFRVKYIGTIEQSDSSFCLMSGKQWIKRTYLTTMMNQASFNIIIDNRKTWFLDPSDVEEIENPTPESSEK